MAIINKYTSIDLDNAVYEKINLNNHHCFYLIGKPTDKTITGVIFSVGVDSGYTGKPLIVQNIVLPVNSENEISGQRFTGFPSEFWIKPLQVITEGNINNSEGEYDIEININPMDFM